MKAKILLLSISVFLGLLLLEIIVRVFNLAPPIAENVGVYRLNDNPRTVYELTPGKYLDGSQINKQGFMDVDFEEEKKDNVIRIAELGDSITEGMRMPIGKKFSDFLEVRLNQEACKQGSVKRYEVMNFGVGGYNLDAEVELLRAKVVKYNPDIVIFNLAGNDNEPIPGLHLWLVSPENGLSEEQKSLLLRHYLEKRNSFLRFLTRKVFFKSKLYIFVMTRIDSIHNNRDSVNLFIKRHHCPRIDNSEEILMRKYFAEIKQLKNEYNFKLLITLHPNLLKNIPTQIPTIVVFDRLAEESGFPHFQLYDYYIKLLPTGASLELMKGDYCHPNEIGHRIIAEAQLSELKKNKFIDLGI